MSNIRRVALALSLITAIHPVAACAADSPPAAELKIDVPVTLKASKVVFNMDHLAFAGDQSVGLTYMRLMLQNYRSSKTPLEIIAVFHGGAGYFLLND